MDIYDNNNLIFDRQYNKNPQFTFKYVIYTIEIKKGDFLKKCEFNNLYYIKININNNVDSSLKLSELYMCIYPMAMLIYLKSY